MKYYVAYFPIEISISLFPIHIKLEFGMAVEFQPKNAKGKNLYPKVKLLEFTYVTVGKYNKKSRQFGT